MNGKARRALLFATLVVVSSWMISATPAIGAKANVQLASSDRAGRPLGTDAFLPPSLDGVGRYLLFLSQADGISAGDTDGDWDLFRKDLVTGKIEWISVGVTGSSSNGDISADGRFVAFYADRTYVRDVNRGVTSVADDRRPHSLDAPAISDDGTKVAFVDSTGTRVADRTTGAVVDLRVGDGFFVDLSRDGRWVVFDEEDATMARLVRVDLLKGDRVTIYEGPGGAGSGPVFPYVSADASVVSFTVFTGHADIHAFVWKSGNIEALTDAVVSAAGQVSDDGRRVLLCTATTSTAATGDVVLLDLSNGATTTLASTNAAFGISISGDGGTVSWTTEAGVVAEDDNGASDVYVTRLRHS